MVEYNSFLVGFITCIHAMGLLSLIIIFCCLNRNSVKKTIYTQTDNILEIPFVVVHPNNDITLTN